MQQTHDAPLAEENWNDWNTHAQGRHQPVPRGEIAARARKTEDLTCDKTDDKDAVLIARLTTQLRCYLPEPVDETSGRLRHLGARREALLTEHTACVQQIRDLLECVWPAALQAAKHPFKSTTWVAALTVIVVGRLDHAARGF